MDISLIFLSVYQILSSDEVFTPPKIVNQVLDQFPKETWTNKSLKIFRSRM